jgi:hypothetical protein
MATKYVRWLIGSAAIAGALAGAAEAGIYIYDTWWAYMLPPYCTVYGQISGDDAKLALPIQYWNEKTTFGIHCYEFTGNGVKTKDFLVDEGPSWTCVFFARGFTRFKGDILISYFVLTGGPMDVSALKRCGLIKWFVGERPINGEAYFLGLARAGDSDYYYCYRWHEGAYRVCKSAGMPEVISYFTPVGGGVGGIAADGQGHVFTSHGRTITKYHDSGSVLTSWNNPEDIKNITLEPEGGLLVLSANKYTYVYNGNGSVLGSFTAPYFTDIHSAAIGPEGKYYVLGSAYERTTVMMYCFNPDPTNVQPTSFGKIKAIYK